MAHEDSMIAEELLSLRTDFEKDMPDASPDAFLDYVAHRVIELRMDLETTEANRRKDAAQLREMMQELFLARGAILGAGGKFDAPLAEFIAGLVDKIRRLEARNASIEAATAAAFDCGCLGFKIPGHMDFVAVPCKAHQLGWRWEKDCPGFKLLHPRSAADMVQGWLDALAAEKRYGALVEALRPIVLAISPSREDVPDGETRYM